MIRTTITRHHVSVKIGSTRRVQGIVERSPILEGRDKVFILCKVFEAPDPAIGHRFCGALLVQGIDARVGEALKEVADGVYQPLPRRLCGLYVEADRCSDVERMSLEEILRNGFLDFSRIRVSKKLVACAARGKVVKRKIFQMLGHMIRKNPMEKGASPAV